MKKILRHTLIAGFLLSGISVLLAQKQEIKVASFDNVVISPHIEATFVEGDRELVTIVDSDVPLDKLNVKVEGKTLKIYLDGAKDYTKSKKVKQEGYKERHQLYDGTQVTATISYKHLKKLSVRGEEDIRIESTLQQSDFELTVYGESDVIVNSVEIDNMKVVMYGESYLRIKEGEIGYQKYKCFGQSEVDALGVSNRTAKITSYGESEIRISVSDRLKVTSYGESEVNYRGNPSIDKGVVLGENSIHKI